VPNIQTKLELLQKKSKDLQQQLNDLTKEQFELRSKCHKWAIKDIASHFIATDGFFLNSIQRSLSGDFLPVEGQPNPGSANAQSMADGIASRAIQISETTLPNITELLQVFCEMEQSLLKVLLNIKDDQWELPAYHPIAKFSPVLFLEMKLIELSIHSWDINSILDPTYETSIEESVIINSIWEKPEINNWLFTPHEIESSVVVCDIKLSNPLRIIAWRNQIEISEIPETSDLIPTATINVRDQDFPLLISARDNLEIAISENRASISGDKTVPRLFHQWFKGT
jgi:hypothetical protein